MTRRLISVAALMVALSPFMSPTAHAKPAAAFNCLNSSWHIQSATTFNGLYGTPAPAGTDKNLDGNVCYKLTFEDPCFVLFDDFELCTPTDNWADNNHK